MSQLFKAGKISTRLGFNLHSGAKIQTFATECSTNLTVLLIIDMYHLA